MLQKKMAADSKADGFIDIWTPLLKVSGGLNATLGGNLSGESLTVSAGQSRLSFCFISESDQPPSDPTTALHCSAMVATPRTPG